LLGEQWGIVEYVKKPVPDVVMKEIEGCD